MSLILCAYMDSWTIAGVCGLFVCYDELHHIWAQKKSVEVKQQQRWTCEDVIASHVMWMCKTTRHFFRNLLCGGLCKHPFRCPGDDTSETYGITNAVRSLCFHIGKTFVVTLYSDIPVKTFWVIASCSDLQERLKRQDSSSWKNEYGRIVLKCRTKSNEQQIEYTLLSCLNWTCAQIWQEWKNCIIGPVLRATFEQHWIGILWKQCRYD